MTEDIKSLIHAIEEDTKARIDLNEIKGNQKLAIGLAVAIVVLLLVGIIQDQSMHGKYNELHASVRRVENKQATIRLNIGMIEKELGIEKAANENGKEKPTD